MPVVGAKAFSDSTVWIGIIAIDRESRDMDELGDGCLKKSNGVACFSTTGRVL